MDALAQSLGENAPSGITLFRDWWRTAAPPNPEYAADIGCTDKLINGFTYTCPADNPRGEASLSNIIDLRAGAARLAPFSIIGLVNRGDLIAGEQSPDTCGEFRVITASETAEQPVEHVATGKFYISFEAALPNHGDGMCLAVQRFWKSLAETNDQNAKHMLRAFFLERIGMSRDGVMSFPPRPGADFEFGPVMSAANLGLLPADAAAIGASLAKPLGQIRTNTVDQTNRWLLRQYAFRRTSLGLRITPTSLFATPPVSIMVPGSGCAEAGMDCNAMLGEKITQNESGLKTLEIGKLGFKLGDVCLEAGQMVADFFSGDGYKAAIWANTTSDNEIFVALQELANRPGLPSAAAKVGFNLTMTSCAGCHRHAAPSHIEHLIADPGHRTLESFDMQPNDFTHARLKCEDRACKRYAISRLLKEVFLPWRAFLMERALNNQ
ncbi:hypothetical protein [Sinorhizobium meliloti]|uniref:hypothetical protein n=1 Tax=Rhizobium meliloti TaxID=382 RepID=UPI000FDB68F2|nr:hypothetical protein [Sinorhizobium meliloti]RVK27628.1 hypothetical protein CN163_30685 [Sinorhizobium meliloti]